MVLLNAAILALIIFDLRELVSKGLKKDLTIYIVLAAFAIAAEYLCMARPGGKSLSVLLLDLFHIKS